MEEQKHVLQIYDQVEVADSFARDCRAENRFNPYRDDTDERIKELTEHYEETVAEVKNNRNLDDECLYIIKGVYMVEKPRSSRRRIPR